MKARCSREPRQGDEVATRCAGDPVERVMLRHAYLSTDSLDIQTEHIRVLVQSLRLVRGIVRSKGRRIRDAVPIKEGEMGVS